MRLVFQQEKQKKKTGVSASQVCRILKRNNITRRSNKTDEKLEQNIIELYINGESSEKIAKNFGINSSTVCRILKRNNIDIRPATENKRKYKIVEDFFENIDTEEKAYFLGFLYADGHIHKRKNNFSLKLKHIDESILKKFAKLIYIDFCDENIKKYNKIYPMIDVYSIKMVSDLIRHGCTPKKSLKIRLPYSSVPNSLMRHFLRGVFDGDGCLSINKNNSRYKVNLIGYYLFIKDVKEYLFNELNINTSLRQERRSKSKEVYDITYSARQDVVKLVNFLYKDSTIYLDRKYNTHLKMIQLIKNKSPIHYGTGNFIKYNGNKLTKNHIESLSITEREKIANFLFDYFRTYDFPYPKYDEDLLIKNFNSLKKSKLKYYNKEIILSGNNINAGTEIFKHFCEHYFDVRSSDMPSMIEAFNNDDILKGTIKNILGITYKECYGITGNMLRRGMIRSYTAFGASIFKPSVAKFIYDKFAPNNSVVLDISAGFGQRMLGASASNKVHKYIGLDPWQKTIDSLNKMKDFLELKNIELHNIGSEKFCDENLKVDFCFSSPPFFNKEIYSSDESQAYFGRTFDEFVVQWWVPTVNNVWRMLNKDGLFVVNMNKEMFEKMMKTINNFKLIDTYNIQYRRSNLGKNSFDYFFILKRA